MLGRCPVFSERLCGDCGSLPDNKRIIPDNKLEKTLCKIVDRVGVKISEIMNPTIMLAVKAVRLLNSVTGKNSNS